jgi:GT2 family glycosyltransferase
MPARRCIEVVRATTGHLDVDVEVVVSSGPEFRISRSLNRGVAAVPGADAWVLLNDDAFMDAGWLDALLGAMRAHPGVGVWGAVLRYPDGRLQHAGGRIALSPFEFLLAASRRGAPLWALRNIWRERGREHPYMFVHHTRVSERNVLDFVTGACMLVTRACRERIGGYDEDYLFGAEDVDYSLRALEAGFEIGLATRATGVHLDRGTGAALAERARTSEALFRERWSGARIRGAARGRVGVYA